MESPCPLLAKALTRFSFSPSPSPLSLPLPSSSSTASSPIPPPDSSTTPSSPRDTATTTLMPPVFDSSKVTVIFVLGGPGAGKRFLSLASPCPHLSTLKARVLSPRNSLTATNFVISLARRPPAPPLSASNLPISWRPLARRASPRGLRIRPTHPDLHSRRHNRPIPCHH